MQKNMGSLWVMAAVGTCAAMMTACGGSEARSEAPELLTFTAAPSSATVGTPTLVTWTWSYANAPTPTPTCTIDNGVGTLASGTATRVTLAADTAFTLTCGNSEGSDTAQATVITVPALPAAVAPLLATFAATPSAVTIGTPTSVTWTWSYANAPWPAPECTIDPDVGSVTSGDTRSITADADTLYTLTCTNAEGTDTAELTLSALPVGAIGMDAWVGDSTASVCRIIHGGTLELLSQTGGSARVRYTPISGAGSECDNGAEFTLTSERLAALTNATVYVAPGYLFPVATDTSVTTVQGAGGVSSGESCTIESVGYLTVVASLGGEAVEVRYTRDRPAGAVASPCPTGVTFASTQSALEGELAAYNSTLTTGARYPAPGFYWTTSPAESNCYVAVDSWREVVSCAGASCTVKYLAGSNGGAGTECNAGAQITVAATDLRAGYARRGPHAAVYRWLQNEAASYATNGLTANLFGVTVGMSCQSTSWVFLLSPWLEQCTLSGTTGATVVGVLSDEMHVVCRVNSSGSYGTSCQTGERFYERSFDVMH